MLEQSIPASRAAEAARIAALTAEFERQQGPIETSPIRIGDPKTPDSWRAYRDANEMPENKKASPSRQSSGATIYDAIEAKSKQREAARAKLAPAIKDMVETGKTTVEIANALGITRKTIAKTADEHGIKLNARVGTPPLMTDWQALAARQAHRFGASISQLATEYSVTERYMREVIAGKGRWASIEL